DRVRGSDRGRGAGPCVVGRDRRHRGKDRVRRTRPDLDPRRGKARRRRSSARPHLKHPPLGGVHENAWAGAVLKRPRPPTCVSTYRRAGSPWHFLYFFPEPHGQGALREVPAYSSVVSLCFSTEPSSLGAEYCNRLGWSAPKPGTTTSSGGSASVSGVSAAVTASSSSTAVATAVAPEVPPTVAAVCAAAAVVREGSSFLRTWTSTLKTKPTDSSLMASSICWNISKPSRWNSISGLR